MKSFFLLGALLVAGCSAGGGDSQLTGSGGPGASSSGQGGSSSGGGLTVGSGGSGGGPADVVAEVFGHSSHVLYKLDPLTHTVTEVGPFAGCSQVIDLAIDADHAMFATTYDGLYAVDRTTAACTLIASGSYPNSLSLVPVGTLDPSEEALVGYDGSAYVRIDKQNGQVTTVGSLSQGFVSSGDIVSVKGGGTYLTVKGSGCDDCLLEIDPSTGDLLANLGSVNHSDTFGLAFWGGSAYGFSNGGELFQISFVGPSVSTTPIAIPGAPVGLSFWGAGSSTSAPLEIPE